MWVTREDGGWVGPWQGADSLGMTLLVSSLLRRKPVGDFVRANMGIYYAS